MPQAIQIETQAEQKSLTLLHGQRATRGASRELAFHRGEEGFDQSPAPVELTRKRSPHLCAHAVDAPGFLPALGGDHTLRAELLPDVGVIPFAVELGVGQHQPDPCLLGSRLDDRRQIRTVVPRATSRDLREQELLIQIGHHDPLQPMPPRQRFLPMMMHAPHEERADRAPRNRRTVSPTARSMVTSSRRCRKRYRVVKSGTLPSPSA